MTVSERIPFSGLLLPLQKGYTYSCDRCATDGMELLFIFREDGRSRYYFEFRMSKPGVTLTGEMCLREDETPIGTGLPMLFDFLDKVRISK